MTLALQAAAARPTPHRSETARPAVERHRADTLAALMPDWRDLSADALEPNVYFGPDFLIPYLAASAPKAAVLTVRAPDGALLALAPVERRRIGFGLAGPIPAVRSHRYAPMGTPLLRADDPVAAWTGLLDGMGSDVIALPDLRLDGPAFAALDEAVRRRGGAVSLHDAHERAALRAGPSAEDYIQAALGPKRRKEIARQGRRLAERGALETDVVTGAAAVAAFESFLTLEASGWKGRAGTALAQDAPALAFARRAVPDLAAAGRLVVDRIRLDGRDVALLLRLADHGRAWPWKIAYAEDLAAFSPGVQVMLQATTRMLQDPAFELADSLAVANHPMIDHLWRDRIRIGTVLVHRGGSAWRAAVAARDLEVFMAARRTAKAWRDRIRPRRAGPAS